MLADFFRMAGSGKDGYAFGGDMELIRDDLTHALQGLFLETFRNAHNQCFGIERLRFLHTRHRGPYGMGRRRGNNNRSLLERLGQIVCHEDRRGNLQLRKYAQSACRRQGRGGYGIKFPEGDVMALFRQKNSQRSTP